LLKAGSKHDNLDHGRSLESNFIQLRLGGLFFRAQG
jgi:hypothetical protein